MRPKRKVCPSGRAAAVWEVLASVPARTGGGVDRPGVSGTCRRVPALPLHSCVLGKTISPPPSSYPSCEKGKTPSSEGCVTMRGGICTVPGMCQASGSCCHGVSFCPCRGSWWALGVAFTFLVNNSGYQAGGTPSLHASHESTACDYLRSSHTAP